MRINQLASKKNLALAWRRITTGGNYQYKRFYRPIGCGSQTEGFGGV